MTEGTRQRRGPGGDRDEVLAQRWRRESRGLVTRRRASSIPAV